MRVNPWLAAVLWIGVIYTSIPLVRPLREAFVARWPAEIIAYAVVISVIGAAIVAITVFRRRGTRLGRADLFWLGGVAVVFLVWTRHLMGQPEEAVHFVEYGVLGVLLHRALKYRIPDVSVHGAAVLVGLLVGTVDEFLQWLTPGRYWDFRDIVLNGGAVALAQIAVWRLAPQPDRAIGRSSLRLLCRLAAVLVLLLMVCLAATPQRLARLADTIPLPARLTAGTDAVCEYGYLHSLDELTAFRSRLTLADLAREDRDRGAEVAAALAATRGKNGPAKRSVSLTDDPFGYEFRIHLFARNRNMGKARDSEPGSSSHQLLMTIVWRENLILEHFFGSTLDHSAARWGPYRRAEIEAAHDPEQRFVSRAGAHLITRVSEGRLRLVMAVLFVLLVACDFLATRSRPGSPPG